ncbi:glutathione S-transferase family protein [Stutzerimonas stutzeri]|uniref:Glutathione S-transferase n=1 Tax=Stutzerimonas stutzeri TaxID=316 RepID=A0A2N8RAJ4_STUST|nr:glutathione S-transferase family protein [Stutzerimonas stutzeri]MCQ4255505.1 glutathione S-transferase family protein [Stutzerimonas stutzeri]PNF58103.1 glutathione S-transferase [Stutzerimonas stutzeri]
MDLHIFGPGFSTLVRSVRLYCEEKGLTYTYGMHLNGFPVSWRSEAHRALHPFGKVPVLLHGSTAIFETMAIFRYLDAAHPERSPTHAPATQMLLEQWSSALVTSVDASLVRNYILPIVGPNQSTPIDAKTLEVARLEAERTLSILDAQLGERAFFCAEHWSIADALLTPMLDYLTLITEPANLLSQWPRLRDYLGRMRTRPSGCAVLQTTPAG